MTDQPHRPIYPGEILQEKLDARGWSVDDLAARIPGSITPRLRLILAGEAPIDSIFAQWLSEVLGTSPGFWLNLERKYRSDLENSNE